MTVDPIVDLSYYIDDACGAPSSIIDTVKFTYTQLQLQQFYVQEAYNEMGDLSLAMSFAFDSGGEAKLRDYLSDIRQSCIWRHGHNHWRSALYDALAGSNDFCRAGFRQLLPADDSAGAPLS